MPSSAPAPDAVLGKLTEQKHCEVVREEGVSRIIVPKEMKLIEAVKWLRRQIAAEETTVSLVRDFPFHPADGAVQLARALKKKYGWTQLVPSGGFFKVPPKLRSIQLSRTETVRVPWGNMVIPGIEGTLIVGGKRDKESGLLRFNLTANVWQRDVEKVEEICQMVSDSMPADSIYRGRSIRCTKDGDILFLDLTDMTPEDLILPGEVDSALHANIFTPLVFTSAVREAGIPLKRGVLLSGRYGTGKTLTATVASNLAEQNNWTFILVQSPTELIKNIQMAKLYQPAVVFVEDIDQTATGGRTENVNELLEAVDGVMTKGSEVMLVMTTNRREKLHGSFMRPGRLDAIIDFVEPDAEAGVRLIKKYATGTLGEFDEALVGDQVAGMIPAAVREVCERAKLYAITRNPDRDVCIETQDLIHASRQLKKHQRLVEQQDHDEDEEFEKAKAVVGNRFRGVFSNNAELAEELQAKLNGEGE